jgi:hypothetical protein
LREALELRPVRERARRVPLYGPRVIEALAVCWVVLRAPTGKRLAPMLPVLVPLLRRDGEVVLTDEEAALLMRRSAATIDRMQAPERASWRSGGGPIPSPDRCRSDPGADLGDWNDAVPGFVEIDLVGHESGVASGQFCFTLTITEIATGGR